MRTRLMIGWGLVAAAGAVAVGCGGADPVATLTQATTVTVTTTAPAGNTSSASTDAVPTLPSDAVPTIYEQALQAVSAGTPVTMRRFVSPSGNFVCDLQVVEGVAGCELTRTTLAPHPDLTCDPTVNARVGRLMIEDGVVSAQCNTDTIRTDARPPVLRYGRTAAVGPGASLQCLSRRIGITCIDTDNRVGFFVSTTGYLVLE